MTDESNVERRKITDEMNLERRQMTFVWPHLQRRKAHKHWPADVLITVSLYEFVPEICRVSYDLMYRDDPVAMAEGSLLVQEWIDVDSITACHDGYSFEVEAMGAKLRFFPDHSPDIDRTDFFIKEPGDLDKLRFNGLNTGRYPYLIECYRAMERYVGLSLCPNFCGPWSMACNLYGAENLIIAAMDEPAFVHELLDRIVTDVSVPAVRALKAVLPSSSEVNFHDAWCTPPLVTPSMFREFIIPHMDNLRGLLVPDFKVKHGGLRITGLQGEDRDFLWDLSIKSRGAVYANEPDLTNFGAEWFRKEADAVRKPLTMLGSPQFIQYSTPEKVLEVTKHLCLVGKNGTTPASVGLGNIGPHTPLINVFTFVRACQVYGAVGTNEDTPFSIPWDFPSFEEFLRGKLENNIEGYTFSWLENSGYSYLLK